MTGQTRHLPVKISNLPDKCPMTGANLQACVYKVTFMLNCEALKGYPVVLL